ncbi:MAG: GGDEF domain-containing protein [bacterium]|nr:GGDEF domain-containing protein [bacterium]
MTKIKRPLNRSIIIVCALFVGLLCIISSILLYSTYTRNMYKRYKKQLKSIVNYVESNIEDHHDMAECAETYISSEKHEKFQNFLDNMIDHYKEAHYIYLMKITGENNSTIVIATANSSYEKEYDPDMLMYLGDDETEGYDDETRKRFRDILYGDEEYVYFTNTYKDDEGNQITDYTLVHPVTDPTTGKRYGLLCADIDINEIKTTVNKTVYINVLMILGIGILFIVLLILWMRKNVTTPLLKLEKSVTEFANSSSGIRNSEELLYIPPEIDTKNEVEALSNAYGKLAIDMKEYIIGIVKAEKEAQGLKQHVSEINALAHKDALTHVKNKTAYEEKKEEIEKQIKNGNATFGIVMADINSLKIINDKYGHGKGDEYIIGACMLISKIYKHSPVYRIGGDEFVVVLQGEDYENRDELIEKAKEELNKAMNDETKDPWNRYSAAIGMSIFEKDDDFDTVFRRADKKMYENKAKIKETFEV